MTKANLFKEVLERLEETEKKRIAFKSFIGGYETLQQEMYYLGQAVKSEPSFERYREVHECMLEIVVFALRFMITLL